MNIINLIILIVSLVVLLGILVFLYIYKSSKKRSLHVEKNTTIKKDISEIPSFNKLLDVIKDNSSSDKELLSSVELIIKYYGTIKPKHGVVADKDFKRYGEAIFAVSRHKNTNKDIVLMFDRELSKRNPNYQREIDEMFNRGLSARG